MQKMLLLGLAIVLCSFLYQTTMPPSLFALIGKWKMQKDKLVYYEEWQSKDQQHLAGKSYKVFKGTKDTIFLETVDLSIQNNAVYFTPTTVGANDGDPVPFLLSSSSKNKFVFTNVKHDFPKRITYHLVTKDSLHAWIDDGTDNKDNQMHFYYSRIKK